MIRKIRLILSFMTSQPSQQLIVINTLLYISRSNGNQTMKLGQLIEYNLKNILLEKSQTKCFEESIPRSFSGKLKVSMSLDQQFKVLYSLFLLYCKLRAIEIYRNYAADHLLLPHFEYFSKIKRGLELISKPRFLHKC